MKHSHAELVAVLPAVMNARLSLFVWGPPGIGKSQAIRDFCRRENIQYIDLRLALCDPTDLRGFPSVRDGKTVWNTPSFFPTSGKGILCLEEINLAPPSLQAAAYQLILDRCCGDYKLPDEWISVATGNHKSEIPSVFQLSKALENRFVHVELAPPSIEEWVHWGLSHGIDPDVLAYLSFVPGDLFQFSAESKDPRWPSPRSWEFTSRLLQATPDIDLERKMVLVASAVGDGIATKFIAFVKSREKIDLQSVISSPAKFEQLEIGLRYSVSVSIGIRFFESLKGDNKETLRIIDFLHQLASPEFGALILRIFFSKLKALPDRERTKIQQSLDQNEKYYEMAQRYLIYVS